MKKIFTYIALILSAYMSADVTDAGLNIENGEINTSQNVNGSKLTKTTGRSTYNYKMDN